MLYKKKIIKMSVQDELRNYVRAVDPISALKENFVRFIGAVNRHSTTFNIIFVLRNRLNQCK